MILGTIFMLIPVVSQAQLFIGEGVHIEKGTQIHVKTDVVLDTEEISGEGEIVLSGDKKQNVIVKKAQTQLAKISIKNKKGAEVKGKGRLVVAEEIYIAKGSSFSGKYLGNILSQDKTINTKTALAVEDKIHKNNQKVEKEFVPEVLGYGFIVNITEVIKKTTSSSAKGLASTSVNNVVANNNDFINLPLINTYYTKESSDYYYTQTYKDEDFSKIFIPPKIV
ncbi:hypothetical protein UJ101_00045 [Flavobacteriaceae bacterium UJ101]|nr:hypothetical protein UJ101_00045 [Flavobacteriaceae bacterium UJ101]